MRLLLPLVLLSCVLPKAGQRCIEGDAYCQDATTALHCSSGLLQPYLCWGPKGCVVDGTRNVTCDQSAGAAPATFCLLEYDGHAQCTKDGKGYLLCAGGAWIQVACAQGKTCTEVGGVTCQ